MKFTPARLQIAPQQPAIRQPLNSKLFLCASLIALSCFWSACGSKDAKAGDAAGGKKQRGSQAIPVTVATAKVQDMPVYLNGLGSVTAFNTVSVKTRIDGEITQIAFKEGQHVNKGDLLAVIDPRPYEVALSQAQAALFRDQAQLRDAKLNAQRFKDLLQNSGAVSQQQVDSQQATADQMEGTVRTDQAAIDNAKLQLSYCRITSPESGRVGLRLVDAGNMVHASDANPLLIITKLQPISVIFTIPEDSLPTVSKHMHSGTLKVDAFSRDDQTKLASGTLLTIDNQIDQTTGTGKLKAVFNNEDNALWPNQFVNVHMLLETRKNALVIPAAAIQRGQQGTYVFTVKADKKVDVRPVTVSITQNNMSAISSGLQENEVVVTDGQDKLDAQSLVEPRTANPTGQHNSQPAAGTPGQ
jgi:multidrug efflux system membrane fusion protein